MIETVIIHDVAETYVLVTEREALAGAGGLGAYPAMRSSEACRIIARYARSGAGAAQKLRSFYAAATGSPLPRWYDGENLLQELLRGLDSFHPAGVRLSLRRVPEASRGYVFPESVKPEERTEAPPELAWIEVRLEDELGEAFADARYELTLPDGSRRSGRFDGEGRMRISDIRSPGRCRLRLPDLEREYTLTQR